MKPWHVIDNKIVRCAIACEFDSDLEAIGAAFEAAAKGDQSAQWALLTCYGVVVKEPA